LAGRIIGVNDDRETPGGGCDAEDPFDRRWSRILDTEADLLRVHAAQLLMTGSISIERAGGVVTARFTGPAWRHHGFLAWHRRPGLDIDAVGANGSYNGARGPMVARYRDRAGLVDEIMFQLAVHLACLEEQDADE
jgi:hypothetical protein